MQPNIVFEGLELVMTITKSTKTLVQYDSNKNQERMMPKMRRFELSMTDTLKVT